MNAREFGLLFGIFYTGLGLIGLMPGSAPVLGLFPANIALALVHLFMGAWGLTAFLGWSQPVAFARNAAFILAALGLMGMIHGLDTLFGLMPLHGHNVWLHLGSAAVAGFIGWMPQTGERRSFAGDRRRAMRAVTTERRRGTYDRRRATYIPTA